ncbi:hypothetical protein NHX12_021420 [Muraenolepis orangiensis]|uniref:Uncharacterized protein n=1 Tax=Muraenolepis orangiensis TaxID=630683 RepID=A0A9Q0ETM6_9TELE|nr:hypothetical protein NHX12_021420 [Muraenolepis orangiensis]
MPHFYVVEFTAERIADAVTIDIIPACWLIDEDKEECWYPRKNASSKVAKAMQPKTDGTWHRCPVKIMRSADTYSDARRKLSDAERKADLTTDGETPSKRKRKPSSKYQRHSSEDESDSCGEDDLPPKPPHGLTPSVSQGGRHSTVPPSASPKRHHSGRQSPIGVRKSPSMRRSSGSQSPSSASEYRVAMVGDIGGTSLDDATRRMMPYLLSNDLAVQFNLHGRHSKRKFREMRLYDVIYGGLKKNALTQETNHKDAEKALSGSLELAIEVEKELDLRHSFYNWMMHQPSRQSLCLSFSTMLPCGWFCHWGLKPKG